MALPATIDETYTPPPPEQRGAGRPSNATSLTGSVPAAAETLPHLWLAQYTAGIRAISPNIDQITRELGGIRLYEDEMMAHPQVRASVDTLILGALSRRMAIRPAVNKKDTLNYARAKQYADLCSGAISSLPRPFKRTLKALARGIVTGHKIADIVWAVRSWPGFDGPLMLPADIKVKPNRVYCLLADPYDNIRYVWSLYSKGRFTVLPPTIPIELWSTEDRARLIPEEKYLIFVNNPEEGECNPGGSSDLRSVFPAYWRSIQNKPGWLAFLATCAQPSTRYIVGPNEPPTYTDPLDPTKTISNVENGLRVAEATHNGSSAAIPYGALLDFMEVNSEGQVFINADHHEDLQIAKGLTGQTLATEESAHQSRASSTNHQDQLDLRVQYLRSMLAHLVETLFRRILRYNFGEAALDLVPIVDLGQFASHDAVAIWQSVAQGVGQGAIFPSMIDELYPQIGWPLPDEDDPLPLAAVIAKAGAAARPNVPPPNKAIGAPA